MTGETVVYVEVNDHGWHAVKVRYPGVERPHTLVVLRTEDEATTAAKGYAVLHGWTLEGEE